jgi:hypothetical protein
MLTRTRVIAALFAGIVLFFAIPFTTNLPSALAAEDWFVIRNYSGIGFTKDEGETYGLAISFVPYSGGEKVLWRMAAGRLETPLLLNTIRRGSSITLVVPPGHEGAGLWKIVEEKNTAIARGPNDLVFKMNRK